MAANISNRANLNTNTKSPNMLFYSRTCKACSDLLFLLKNEKMLAYFKLICVDDILDNIPKSITQVPTLLLTNINKPLVCKEIFEWIKTVKSFSANVSHGKLDNLQGFTFESTQLVHVTKDKDNTNFVGISDESQVIVTPSENKNKITDKDFYSKTKEIIDTRKEQSSFFSNIFKNEHQKIIKSYENEIKNAR